MATNQSLKSAKSDKQDEFYTQLADIEKELRHYKEQFKGKIVFCNCDDPYESNFFRYFALNFNKLGLRQLITTSYKPSPIANTQLGLFGNDKVIDAPKGRPKVTANKFVINEIGDIDGDGAFDLRDIAEQLKANSDNEWAPLEGDGDFRSPECIDLLRQSDIVVTNPPFSLFRAYIAQLIEHDKKFLIIGNVMAATNKDTFQLMKENKVWLGYNNGGKTYRVPDYYRKKNVFVGEDGNKYTKMGNTGWYTNLVVSKRHEIIPLYKKYTPEDYPTYANYDAIEVNKYKDIPSDYYEDMGVSVTFLDKYNPDQFELIGSSLQLGRKMSEIAEKGTYPQGGPRFYLANKDGNTYKRLFDRIVIKRKAGS
jgi:hypothetical protein